MSATVATALKKIAVFLLTDKRALKTVCGIVLGILVIIIMPVAAVIGIFNGDVNIDTDRLQQMVVENLSDEEKTKLQFVEDTMSGIEEKMTAAGFPGKVKDAQILYASALSDRAHDNGFIDKLVGCFAAEQTDEQLIAAVNSAFGTNITVEDFLLAAGSTRTNAVNVSDYIDPSTKNNLDLVKWAVHAEQSGWGYVFGTYGEVLDKTALDAKSAQYPEDVGESIDFIQTNWLGRRTADCIGLIKGYSWYDIASGKSEIGSNGMPDIGANKMYENALEKGTIDTIPEIPGLAVWLDGHIGIYIGNGEVVQAANTRAGVIRTQLSDTGWTHWLKIPYITYMEEAK